MTFYILAGLSLGFYVAMTSVYPIICNAKEKANINNTFTRNISLSIALNILFLAIIWPVLIPYFFSPSYRNAVEKGFELAIHAED